jgi:hypothetical protein
MNRHEVLRRRRCLALRVAIFFGVLLPVAYWSWSTLAVAVAGIALAAFTYWRECRAKTGSEVKRTGA